MWPQLKRLKLKRILAVTYLQVVSMKRLRLDLKMDQLWTNKKVMKFILLKKLAKKVKEARTNVILKLRKTRQSQVCMKTTVTTSQKRMHNSNKPLLLLTKSRLKKLLHRMQILSIKGSHLKITKTQMKTMKRI
jgi:hypothetical protein